MWKRHGLAALVMLMSLPAYADKPDSWVTTKTKLTLLTTSGVDSGDVSVDTLDGAVTLYGKVESSAAKQKAEAETSKIEGVKTVRNLLQVVPKSKEKAVSKSDKEIKDAVKEALKADDQLRNSSVEVESVDNGLVLLSGKVTGPSAELRAVRDAKHVAGVHRVASEMKGGDRALESDTEMGKDEIARTGETHPGTTKAPHEHKADTFITTDVKLAIISEKDMPTTGINVDTRDGRVTLFGMVPTANAKHRAELAARKVDGVTGVENALSVVPKSEKKAVKAADKDIKSSIKASLEKHDALDDVDVDVKGGVVRLTGSVPSHEQKLEAVQVSRQVPGVRSVSSDLQIKEKD